MVRSEEDIFNSILRWNKFDENNRKLDTKEIIKDCIRDVQLPHTYLERLRTSDPEFYACLSTHTCNQTAERKDEERRCRGFTNVIVAAGGEGPISM